MFRQLKDRTYMVGGCVRDEILGKKPHDVDYVIEATEEEFRAVFPEVPKVGKKFPVFMIGGNEVALTRTERCTGEGYTNYEVTGVGVPIADDLLRRDFTVNSIAKHVVTGAYVDPTNGLEDISKRTLRCANSLAFSDDPLRILRGARFSASLRFDIDTATFHMMWQNGERLAFIDPERVELELQKLWKDSTRPEMFFYTLNACHGLDHHFRPLLRLADVPAGPVQYHGDNTGFDHTMEVVQRAKQANLNFSCFIACLVHDFGKGTTHLDVLPHHNGHEVRSREIAKGWFEQHRFDAHTMKLALCVAINHMNIHQIDKMRTHKAIEFFKRIPRDMQTEFVACCDCDHTMTESQMDVWLKIKHAVATVKIDMPKDCKDPSAFVLNLTRKRYNEITHEVLTKYMDF